MNCTRSAALELATQAAEQRALRAYRLKYVRRCDYASTHDFEGVSYIVTHRKGGACAIYREIDGDMIEQLSGQFFRLVMGRAASRG
jgi:hypothetical protein